MAAVTAVSARQPDLVQYVNTLQGTNSDHDLTRGNTYPTTALPFGMHTWSPQTGENGSGWKYQYAKDSIRGFQQAHQCSSWTRDYCVFSLMPVTGELATGQHERAARFSHDNEIAKPHYYCVELDNGIRTEISPTERGAHLRFTFPDSGDSYIVLDGYNGLASVRIDTRANRITGWVTNGAGLRPGFRNYFVIQFDTPFYDYGTWEARENIRSPRNTSDEGRGRGAYVRFSPGVTVEAKVASSYISPEQAQLNLERELGPYQNLDETKEAAWQVWNDHLNRILVEGGSEEDKATFYSCFFRASLFSRKFYELDPNGKPYYFSPNDYQVHDGYFYTDTGFWDTFRAQFPLSCLLHPTMQGRYMQAMLDVYDQCGWLPSWSFPHEAGSMIGNHAISLFADAWVKGIRTFDPEKALEAYYHEATNKGPWGPANGRDGWRDYYLLGYVPYPEVHEATAKTLEYAYDDFCGYALAKMTGNDFYADVFARQMYNYRNVFDPATGFMRGRDRSGNWTPQEFDPTEWGGPYTEGAAWHYLWSVFHDVEGLKSLLGGDDDFVLKLDSVFTATNDFKVGTYGRVIHEMAEMKLMDMGQYAHGNQPIQHMVYLYSYTRQPWKAQYHARNVMRRMYDATENGYPGDEDQGQTSSWYVLSALGLYSVCPGTDQYVLGSPLFPKTTVTFEDGRQLVIEANGNSDENLYIKSASLNGVPFTRNYLTYDELVSGGILKYEMSSQPNRKRGTRPQDWPFSLTQAK